MKLSPILLSAVRACSVGPDNQCIANDNVNKGTLCGKLKWYCHDPSAQATLDQERMLMANIKFDSLPVFA